MLVSIGEVDRMHLRIAEAAVVSHYYADVKLSSDKIELDTALPAKKNYGN
ncbi:hypothetical protein OKW21_002987 [Catalinimonas alkaloidigena]|nr:hypothetical protein [Catalinimonas alkaloidigena]MDF9797724.1 hypothetical protein [Catalinimonas alkaloidigena]